MLLKKKLLLLLVFSSPAFARDPKIFSLFSIVRIPDLQCTGSDGVMTGNCYSADEMSKRGLTSIGTCASGFGQCGVQIVKETGIDLTAKTSYIQNPDYPSASTSATVMTNNIVVSDTDVCQIRLDFEKFTMTPVTLQDEAAGNTKCSQVDYMSVTSEIFSSLRSDLGVGNLCGNNEGQHMYIGDFNATDKNVPGTVAKIKTTIATTALYSVKVSQIDCTSTDANMVNLRAPPDCRKYYRDSKGTLTNFNFGNNGKDRYEASLDYNICIRRALTDCQITYVRTVTLTAKYTSIGKMAWTNDPKDAGTVWNCYDTTTAANEFSNNACSTSYTYGCFLAANKEDYVEIPEARYLGKTSTTKYAQNSVFCGVGVGWDIPKADQVPAATSTTTLDGKDSGQGVITQAAGVWSVKFHSGAGVVSDISTDDPSRLGMSLDYQTSSTCSPDFRTCTDCTLTAAITRRKNPENLDEAPVAEAVVVDDEQESEEENDDESYREVLQKILNQQQVQQQILNQLQKTPGPIVTTTTLPPSQPAASRYNSWNRFPYEQNNRTPYEQSRNFFKNPPGRH